MDGPASSVTERDAAEGLPVAPRWHTAALLALQVGVAVTGLLQPVRATPGAAPDRVTGVYLPMLVVQIALMVYVVRIGRPRSALGALIGTRWTRARRAIEDLALAAGGWVAITGIEWLWPHGTAATVNALLPHGAIERCVWSVVALVVGTSEEIVFRGYLQTQFTAFTRRASVAVVLQAMVFALVHADQGAGAAMRAGLYGLGFGAMARWRRSLLPGIACHAWTDMASGLWGV